MDEKSTNSYDKKIIENLNDELRKNIAKIQEELETYRSIHLTNLEKQRAKNDKNRKS